MIAIFLFTPAVLCPLFHYVEFRECLILLRARAHAGCVVKNAPQVLYLRINSCCCFRIVRCCSLFPLSRQYKSSLCMTHIHAPSKPVLHCPQRLLKIATPFLVNAWILRQVAVYTKGLVPCTCLSCQTVGEDFWLVEDECVRACFGNECTRSQTLIMLTLHNLQSKIIIRMRYYDHYNRNTVHNRTR